MSEDLARPERSGIVAVAIATGVIVAIVVAVLIAFDLDFSAARDIRTDVVLRDAYPGETLPGYRFSDTSPFTIWLPSDHFVWRSVRSGHLPLWFGGDGGGQSPFTAYFLGVMHPLRWIVAAVPLRQGASVLMLLGCATAFLGMFVLARRGLHVSPFAALVAASSFVFSGYMLSALFFSGVLIVIAHLPWIVLFYLLWAEHPSPMRFLALTFSLALLLVSGHPSIIFGVTIAGGIAIAGDAMFRRRPVVALVGVASAACVALLLDAFVLLPFLLHWNDVWTYKTAMIIGRSWHALTWTAWREALTSTILDIRRASDHIDDARTFYFFGIGTVVLAVIGLSRALREKRLAFVAMLIAIGLVLSFPPPPLAFVGALPGIGYCKLWYLLIVCAFGISLSVSLGAEIIIEKSAHRSAMVATVILAVIIAPQLSRCVELVSVARAPRLDSSVLGFLRQHRDSRITGMWGQTHLPNASELTGVEDVRISSPVLSKRYHAWMSVVAPGTDRRSFPTTLIPDRFDSPYLGAFNVRYIVQSRLPNLSMYTLFAEPGHAHDPRYVVDPPLVDPAHPLVYRSPSVDIYENLLGYRSRAEFPSSIEVVPEGVETATASMRRHRVDPDPPAIVESNDASAFRDVDSRGTVRAISRPDDATVVLDVDAAARSLVVLHESWDRGWNATVDGTSAEIFPVDLISRGVVVGRGQHRIVMHYAPEGMRTGGIVSVSTFLVLVALVILLQRRAESAAARLS